MHVRSLSLWTIEGVAQVEEPGDRGGAPGARGILELKLPRRTKDHQEFSTSSKRPAPHAGSCGLNAAPGQGSSSLFGRNWVHGPALTLAREHEALVAVLCDLGALSAVSADALRPEIG